MKRIILMLLMGLALVSSVITGGTTASFTSQSASTPSTFTAGRLEISATPTAALVTIGNMIPGRAIQSELTVAHAAASTLDFRYAMVVDATNADSKGLRTALQLRVSPGACPATPDPTPVPATDLYNGPLFDPSAPALSGAMVVFGDPSTHGSTSNRLLARGTSEKLCLTTSLPAATSGGYQAATTTATLTLHAQQV